MYRVYEIMTDDTLESLAYKYCIDCEELCRLNGITVDDFIPGNFIVLPKENSFYDFYIVQSGDTLFSLSKKFDIDLKSLYAINGLDEGDYIYPGQELLVPKSGFTVYVTKDNESLSDISNNIGVTPSQIISFNPNVILNSDQLLIFK